MPRKQFSNEKNSTKILTLTLVLTRRCNLRCTYCYEKHAQRDDKVMDFVVAKEQITSYMESNNEFDGVEIDFFGGEPMLCFSLICQIVEWFYSIKWKKSHRLLISTNGTILTDEMKNWLYKNSKLVTVSLSIDGNKTAHNLTRDNSYDLIYRNISFFMENWPHQPAKMTIIGDTIPYIAESIFELEEMGMNFTANIAFEDFWGDSENKKKLLRTYQEQLDRLVDYYAKKPNLFPVTPMLTAVPDYLGIPGYGKSIQEERDCTRYCGAGHEMVTVDVDGEVYPCHRFLPWVTGKPAPKGPTNIQSNWQPENCLNCKIVSSCPTCAGYNWEINGDSGIRTTFHCEAHKREVIASAKLAALRLVKIELSEIEKFTTEEQKELKRRIEAIWELVENGI